MFITGKTMKTLLALLILIPFNLSAEVKEFLKGTKASLLDLGMFKLEVYLDNNLSDIKSKAFDKINYAIFSSYRDKYLSNLDFSYATFQHDLSGYLDKFNSFTEFSVYSGFNNDPERIFITLKVGFEELYTPFTLDKLKGQKKYTDEENKKLYEEITEQRIKEGFDSEKFCKIIRDELMSKLSFKYMTAKYKQENDLGVKEGLILNSHKDIYDRFFASEGKIYTDSFMERGGLLNIYVNVLYSHSYYDAEKEKGIYDLLICHGKIGEIDPSFKKSDNPSDYMMFELEVMSLQ